MSLEHAPTRQKRRGHATAIKLDALAEQNPDLIALLRDLLRMLPMTNKAALTIPEFCTLHNISEAHFYALQAKEPPETPKMMEVGARRLISVESAARWRLAREQATAIAEATATGEAQHERSTA